MSIEIISYYPSKNPQSTFKGTFSICVPKWGNFCIYKMKYFSTDKGSWVTFPQEKYVDKENKEKYISYNGFKQPELYKKFLDIVYQALKKYIEDNPQHALTQTEIFEQYSDEIPF